MEISDDYQASPFERAKYVFRMVNGRMVLSEPSATKSKDESQLYSASLDTRARLQNTPEFTFHSVDEGPAAIPVEGDSDDEAPFNTNSEPVQSEEPQERPLSLEASIDSAGRYHRYKNSHYPSKLETAESRDNLYPGDNRTTTATANEPSPWSQKTSPLNDDANADQPANSDLRVIQGLIRHSRSVDDEIELEGLGIPRPGWKLEKASPISSPVVTSCPICRDDISGLSVAAKSLHTNGCLDGHYVLPSKLTNFTGLPPRHIPLTDELIKQLRNILPRGTWMCCNCQAPVIMALTKGICERCGHKQDSRCPIHKSNSNTYHTPLGNISDLLNYEDHIHRSVIVVGDERCGKSWMICKMEGKQELDEVGLGFSYSRDVTIENEITVQLRFTVSKVYRGWDKQKQVDGPKTRQAIFLCFDVCNETSFQKVEAKWNKEANKLDLKKLPKILVGCKIDQREDNPLAGVAVHRAEALAKRIGALAYFETSAVDGRGIEELAEYAAKAALIYGSATKEKTGLRRFLSRNEAKST